MLFPPLSQLGFGSFVQQTFRCSAWIMVFLSFAPFVNAEQVDVWFGTTATKQGLSKGIYHANFDTDTGELSQPTLAVEADSPGFLAMHPNGKMLYAAARESGKDVVVAYKIKKTNEQVTLTKVNSIAIGDGKAVHLSVDRSGKFLLTAQYRGGSTALFDLADDGSIISRRQLLKHQGGSGVVQKRQDKPHAHWVGTSPDNQYVFVPDLGMDKVVIWKLDTATATLSPHGFGICPPGSGPRHMKFDPTGTRIYVLNELTLSITTFDYDKTTGTMTPVQTVETLSEATKAKEVFNSASEIRVHPSGKFVYSANRGNDTISVFRVDPATKNLSFVEVEPIRGSWPRNFNLDPTGKWLIAAGQKSNTATVFSIDQSTGELTYVRKSVTVPSSICVLFD